MSLLPVYALPLFLAAGAPPDPADRTRPGPPLPGGHLGAEDARYLDFLVGDFLFDPKDATRVQVIGPGKTLVHRGGRMVVTNDSRDGWLVRGKGGEPNRVYFTDGESIPAPPGQVRAADFEAECAGLYRYDSAPFSIQTRMAFDVDMDTDPHLARAAWLHRRGYDRLAARALAAARAEDDDPAQDLRWLLARRAGRAMATAFIARADADALAHGERLFRLYPDLAPEKCPQAADILADLKRRRRAGTFGKAPPADWPAGFAGWDVRKKVAYLIDSLDEIGRPPGAATERWQDFTDDRRYRALVGLGDAAVPALIDAVETDGRLTRTTPMLYGRDELVVCGKCLVDTRQDKVVEVREVARRLLRDVLRVRYLEPARPVVPDEDEESPAALADRLRRYWAAYGHLSLDDRLMAVLTDPKARPPARRDAAGCLVADGQPDSPSWPWRHQFARVRPAEPGRLVAKYRSPSVAEAILTAMDAELAELARLPDAAGPMDSVEERYLDLLVDLGDHRAGPELAARGRRARGTVQRLRYAEAAHRLGVSGPLVALYRDIGAGRAPLADEPKDGKPDREAMGRTLEEVVRALTGSPLPEAGEALYALADPAHPYFPVTFRAVSDGLDEFRRRVDLTHPFHLGVLAHGLSDRRPTGAHFYLRGTEVEETTGAKPQRHPLPERIAPAGGWREHAEQTVADRVADRLACVAAGLPAPHPLRADADRVRAEMREALRRYSRTFRLLTGEEQGRLGMNASYEAFIPDVRPLGRPATAADVKAGRAVFELGGKGRVADGQWPAWLLLKSEARSSRPGYGLVVQAEVGADGKVVYGVIFRGAIRAVRADEVDRVEPVEKR